MSKLKISLDPKPVKEALATVYKKLSLDTYTRNLPYNFQQMVRIKEIKTLEDAIQFVTKEEQFLRYKRTIEYPSIKTNNVKHQTNHSSQNVSNKPNQVNQSRPFNSNQYNPSPFQNQNKYQQQIPMNKHYSYQQIFGNPMSNPNSNNQINNNQHNITKPTLMSGISSIKLNQFNTHEHVPHCSTDTYEFDKECLNIRYEDSTQYNIDNEYPPDRFQDSHAEEKN